MWHLSEIMLTFAHTNKIKTINTHEIWTKRYGYQGTWDRYSLKLRK